MLTNQTSIILPLEAGDRLSRPEFERRYRAAPHIKKAELIEGVVYMPSPVRAKSHSQPHGLIRHLAWSLQGSNSGRRTARQPNRAVGFRQRTSTRCAAAN